MTLQNSIDEYLIEQQIRGNSEKTVIYYRRCLGFFSAYFQGGVKNIDSVTLNDCKGYYMSLRQRDITSTTIQTYIRALRAFLTWCYSEGYIQADISAKFRLPKAQRKTYRHAYRCGNTAAHGLF